MNLPLNPTLFRSITPEQDRDLQACLVPPTVLPALLNPESVLLAAPNGYGKSTLVFMAQQRLQKDWLQINLNNPGENIEDFMPLLLRQITLGMWQYIETNPGALAKLQTRAVAVYYFLQRCLDIDLDFSLGCLVDDFPEYTEAIQTFKSIEQRELFTQTASDTQRLSILCDCVQKLGLQGVMLWFDLNRELHQTSPALLHLLQEFFDSLHLMRRRTLHSKCLAPPSVCHHLQRLRGAETLSVNQLSLAWEQEQLQAIVNQRLQLSSTQQIQSLTQLLPLEQFVTFLHEFSDVGSPLEWLTLTGCVVENLNVSGVMPLSEDGWLAVRRAYCAERVKLRLDEQGSFWRGKQLLADLTPKKRAIYPLVKYLYEHPGVHRTYKLTDELDVDETNLNTIISRARKDHLEPFLPADDVNKEDAWIYLVTDLKGGGYELKHTDRSP